MIRPFIIAASLALICSVSACRMGGKTAFVRYPKHKPSTLKPLRTMDLGDGLIVEDLRIGEGLSVKPKDWVYLHYSGWFKDDLTKFDSSIDRVDYVNYQYGVHRVNPGWDKGMLGMRVGGKRRIIIPCKLAYGQEGSGPVPPGKDLIYEIDLALIKRK